MKKVLSFLLVAVFMLSLVLTGCGSKTATHSPGESSGGQDQPEVVDPKTMEFKEAPMLAELVKQGKLPPVKERLPENPVVLTQAWNEIPSEDMQLEIGKYGGTIRFADPATEGGSAPEMWCFSNEPLLVTPGIDTLGGAEKGLLKGNVFESYEASQDNKVFTFHMRKGLKWSDGDPVDTEDVRFHFEDYMFNEELVPSVPAWFRVNGKANGEPGKVEILDDYTFTVTFPEPYPIFPIYIANRWNNPSLMLTPSHYMKKFHIKYTSLDELKPLLKENSFEENEWFKLYAQKQSGSGQMGAAALDYPKLEPWIYKGQPAQGVFVFERNPYYFKVDAAGQQLPYIDRIECHWITDLKGQTMKIIAGEVDFAVNRTNVIDFPIFKENEANGGYNVTILKQHVTPTDVFLNLTHPDPVWRQVVRDLRFRQALNYAINREHIIEAVQLGYGSLPTKAKVPFEYNPDKANKLLDEMGLDKRDSEGYRLGPDGKRFVIPFEIAIWTVGSDKVTELVAQYWRDVGIYTTMKVIDMGLANTRRQANDIKAQNFWLDWAVIWDQNPSAYHVSLNQVMNDWGILWKNWHFSGGKEGEEPPPEVKQFIAKMEEVIETGDDVARRKAMDEVFKLLYDNIFFFPIAESGYPMIYNKKLGNIPTKTMYGITAAYSGEQFFYKE